MKASGASVIDCSAREGGEEARRRAGANADTAGKRARGHSTTAVRIHDLSDLWRYMYSSCHGGVGG